MKKLIFLKTIDSNPTNKKIKASELVKLEENVRLSSIKKFKNDIKSFGNIKILQESLTKPQIIIEFADKDWDDIYKNLITLNEIDIIDFLIPEKI